MLSISGGRVVQQRTQMRSRIQLTCLVTCILCQRERLAQGADCSVHITLHHLGCAHFGQARTDTVAVLELAIEAGGRGKILLGATHIPVFEYRLPALLEHDCLGPHIANCSSFTNGCIKSFQRSWQVSLEVVEICKLGKKIVALAAIACWPQDPGGGIEPRAGFFVVPGGCVDLALQSHRSALLGP